jgi:hypothetical protein
MAFSPSLLIRFLHPLLKIYLHIFVVLEGNTGIRKTRSISLIRTLIALSNADPDRVGVVPW